QTDNSPGGAQGVSYSAPGNPEAHPWKDDTKYRLCEQGCLYDKANENISFQALYSARKLELIENAISKNPDDLNQVIQEELHNFCMEGEESGKCFLRYKQSQYVALNQMKYSIVTNSDSVSRLGQNFKKTTWTASNRNKNKEAQVTYVPTFEDMAAYYAGMDKAAQTIGTDQYVQQLRETYGGPKKEQFLLYKTVPKDENDPTGQPVLLKVRRCEEVQIKVGCDCDKDGCYDLGELKIAQEKYGQWAKLMGDDLKSLNNPQPATAKLKNPVLKPKLVNAVGKLSFQAFREARNRMMIVRNKEVDNPEPTRKVLQRRDENARQSLLNEQRRAVAPGKPYSSGSNSSKNTNDKLNPEPVQNPVFGDIRSDSTKISLDPKNSGSNPTHQPETYISDRDLAPQSDRRPADARDDVYVNMPPDLIKEELKNIKFE
ncbi:MAG: hypothetical protein AABZ55_05265, partial [Bdellovibrionota bacterium]